MKVHEAQSLDETIPRHSTLSLIIEAIVAVRSISNFLLIRHPPPFTISLSPCYFILYDVQAMAPLTVGDKIGQLRHLGERGSRLVKNHVRVLHSMARNFSPFASVFVSGNRIGQVADKWRGGETGH